jgi:hypothetical protein
MKHPEIAPQTFATQGIRTSDAVEVFAKFLTGIWAKAGTVEAHLREEGC